MIPETVNDNPVRWVWALDSPMFPAGYQGDALTEKTHAFLLSASDEGTDDERFWVTCLAKSGDLMAGDMYYTLEAAKRFPSQEFDISPGEDNWVRFTSAAAIAAFNLASIDGSPFGVDGYYCDKNHLQVVLPLKERYVDESRGHYVFGLAGVDGIEFVLKPHDDGIYAYYPSVDEIHKISINFESFIGEWRGSGVSL